jgi:NAD(P)-dependent dehydrogenase (short-subunit alcohol dehydrogenase family)
LEDDTVNTASWKDIAGVFGAAAIVVALLTIMAVRVSAQESVPSAGQRVVLVTGSTGGLGRETARALAHRGDHVIVHGRNVERGEALVADITAGGKGSARFYRADFGSLHEIRNLGTAVLRDYDRLDVLVNNAGIYLPNSVERRLSDDGYELTFQINYLAGYVLTKMLIPLLEASAPAQIINVASAGQAPLDFDNLMLESGYEGGRAYAQSKLAQIMMTFSLADSLSTRGITINALHPSSYMNTDMVLEAGIKPRSTVETGRDALLHLINDDVGTGKYFNVFEEARPLPQAYDAAAVARLMDVSDDLVSEKADDIN